MKASKTLIVVCGPTAAGKTKLAIQLAQYFNAEIFSADARQFYKEIEIGTAKPNKDELSEVPHHFINNKTIHETYTAGAFEKDAIAALNEYFKTRDIAILCGGSGLYIKAVTEGIEEKEKISDSVRHAVAEMSENEISHMLRELDPEYYEMVDKKNLRRTSRALELIMNSGKKMNEMNTGKRKERDFNFVYVGTDVPREKLYERINERVDKMIDAGLKQEAENLYSARGNQALETVGYKEWFDFFDGKISESEAVNLIKQNTRNYAKRQLTWFKKVEGMHWLNPTNLTQIIDFIKSEIKY